MFRLISLRFFESYFRHRWLNLLPILIAIVAALVSFLIAKPSYMSKGVIFVQRESLLAQLTSIKGTDVNWQTPALLTVGELNELLQTDSFLRAVINQTDLEAKMAGGQDVVDETLSDVRKAVWTGSQGDNQVEVTAAYEQPQVAFQLVNATIETFIQWKINAEKNDSGAAHKFFTELIVRYKQEVDDARQEFYDYLKANPEPLKGDRTSIEQLEIARLQAQLDLANNRYASALEKDENAQLATAQAEEDLRQSYILIDAPRLPDKPERSLKDTLISVAVFVVAGVLLSGAAVTGEALLDRTFRFPIDVWQGVNLRVLTEVPDVSPKPQREKRRRKKAKADREVEWAAVEADVETAPKDDVETPDVILPEWGDNGLLILTRVPEVSNYALKDAASITQAGPTNASQDDSALGIFDNTVKEWEMAERVPREE